MKKGVFVDEVDDDELKTSVSQDRVMLTLCSEELFPRIQYIKVSSNIRQVKRGGRRKWMVNGTPKLVPAGFTPPS